ncbi:MAG: DUF5004 domain-containing protein [Prevotella sp.]|nr:DUF5004 domain-containing protein [Prevotella sp.]
MKKLFFAVCSLACMALFVACAESEPTLVGQWKSDAVAQNDSSTSTSIVIDLNLAKDSTLTFDANAVMDSKDKEISIHMPFNMGFEGTWSVDGEKMTWTPKDSSQYCKFEKDSVQVKFGDPTMEAFGDKIIKSFIETFEKEGSKEILGEFVTPEPMAYVLEGNVLKIVSEKDTMVFHRQAAKK